MGIPVLIIGKSGSGKSTSLRNFGKDEILYINVSKKPLPFRGSFRCTAKTDNYNSISELLSKLKEQKLNTVVIDDAGYLITNMFMRGHSSNGRGNAIFSFYNDIADRFWNLIEAIKKLPEDVIVYVIMHENVNDDGEVKPKTIGKILDDKVCIEGMFTIVLRCIVKDNRHCFLTQTEGTDVSKSPIDMFEEQLIDNDLKAVDTIIREYYEIGGTENE